MWSRRNPNPATLEDAEGSIEQSSFCPVEMIGRTPFFDTLIHQCNMKEELMRKLGNSGHSMAPHLHFQIMDGADWLTA